MQAPVPEAELTPYMIALRFVQVESLGRAPTLGRSVRDAW